MDRFQYLMLLGGCLLLTLPLEFVFGARVWRRPRRLFHAIWPGLVVFGIWDIWAIQRGHWTFSRRLTTGVKLPFDFPLDEVAFFVAIPICGLLTFGAVRNILDRPRGTPLLEWLKVLSGREWERQAGSLAASPEQGRPA